MNTDRYQVILITLSDGRSGSFIGRVLVEPEEHGVVKIKGDGGVVFFAPKPLPPDCHFGLLEGD